MSTQVILQGTLNSDGTLALDEKPKLPPGRVRVTVETVSEPARPDRFWIMMQHIWTDLKASGHVPRSVEEIEADRQAFRKEWDERQEVIEHVYQECERSQSQAGQSIASSRMMSN